MTQTTHEAQPARSSDDEIIDIYGKLYGLTPVKPMPILGFSLMRRDLLVGVAEVKVVNKPEDLFVGLFAVQEMRKYATCGIKARVIFAAPKGIWVQAVEFDPAHPAIQQDIRLHTSVDGFSELVVMFPFDGMTRIADSKKEWFQ